MAMAEPLVLMGQRDLGLARSVDGLARLVDLVEGGEVEVLVRVGLQPGRPDGDRRVVLVAPIGFPQGGYKVGDVFPVEAERIVVWPAELSPLVARP
jgi:hypothetical protein